MTIRKVKPNEWPALQKLNHEVFVDNAKYDPDISEIAISLELSLEE